MGKQVDDPRRSIVSARLTAREYGQLESLARTRGESLSDTLRHVVRSGLVAESVCHYQAMAAEVSGGADVAGGADVVVGADV